MTKLELIGERAKAKAIFDELARQFSAAPNANNWCLLESAMSKHQQLTMNERADHE